MSFELTKNEILKEILKSGKDPVYFINNYARIAHPLKGLIPFKLYDFQEDLLRSFNDHRFNVILKARQLGISTTTAAYIAWMMLFHRNKNILVVATKFQTAGNLVKKVKHIIKNLPPWMQIANIDIDNRASFVLSNGSEIKASSTSADAGRSEALSLLVVDEAGHVEGLDELWTGLYPTLSCVTGDTLVLTTNGMCRIEDFHIDKHIGDYFELNDLEVWGKKGIEKVSHGYVSPESDTLKITTAHGLQLEVTYKHPLYKLASSGGKMTQAHDLKIGDALRVDVGMEIFGNTRKIKEHELTPEFAYMLGGFIAEGWITGTNARGNGNVIWISNTDKEFRDIYLQHSPIKNFTPDLSGPHKIRCCSVELSDLFAAAGIFKEWKCDTKQTPSSILSAPKSLQVKYLSGLFDGDGSVTTGGIVLNSTSIRLLRETQQLLLNVGIISNIIKLNRENILERERKSGRLLPQGKRLQSLREAWNLIIPRSYYRKFANEVGLHITRKQEKLIKLSQQYLQDGGKCETIPVREIKETLEGILKTSGKSQYWFREQGIRFDKCLDKNWQKRTVNYEWIARLKSVVDASQIQLTDQQEHFFSEMLDIRCFWDEIVSIEKSTNKTYDFTVPETHSFLQNGILGSNTGGRCIALSTPNGVGNWFHQTYVDASASQNNFVSTVLLWDVHPERDLDWFEKETKNMSRRQIAQELECNFNMSGETVIHPDELDWIQTSIKEPQYRTGFDRNFWIWEKAQDGCNYLLTADVARGDGKDNSTLHIIKLETMEIVAEYQGKPTLDVYSNMLNSIGREFNNGMIVVENNSVGIAVLTKLQELQYPNLYFSIKSTHEYVEQLRGEHMSNAVPGFSTTSKTRPLIIAKLEEFIRNKLITIYSSRMYNELKTFIWNHGRPEAMRGYNDDLTLALAIGCWVRDTAFEIGKLEQQYRDVFVDSMFVASTKLNTQIKGQEGYRADMDLDSEHEISKKMLQQFGWLYKG